jgi:hypothetical protein
VNFTRWEKKLATSARALAVQISNIELIYFFRMIFRAVTKIHG